jgi:hypothetical protein
MPDIGGIWQRGDAGLDANQWSSAMLRCKTLVTKCDKRWAVIVLQCTNA